VAQRKTLLTLGEQFDDRQDEVDKKESAKRLSERRVAGVKIFGQFSA
jgi:hypothetical protein